MPADDSAAPIFILSAARSGSTLLRVALDSHPQVCSPPEVHLLELAKKLLWAHRLVLEDSRPDAGIETWSLAIPETRERIQAIMGRYCEIKQKPIWCEKSVTSVKHLDVLGELFPEARRVCLYRAAGDVVVSALRATAERPDGFDFEQHFSAFPHNRVEALLRYWLDRSDALLRAERDGGSIRIRYEDLVAAPDEQLARLADWLGLASMPGWSDVIFNQAHDRGPGDGKIWEQSAIHTRSVGAGRDLLDLAGVPRNLIRKVNRCLDDLNYPPLD